MSASPAASNVQLAAQHLACQKLGSVGVTLFKERSLYGPPVSVHTRIRKLRCGSDDDFSASLIRLLRSRLLRYYSNDALARRGIGDIIHLQRTRNFDTRSDPGTRHLKLGPAQKPLQATDEGRPLHRHVRHPSDRKGPAPGRLP